MKTTLKQASSHYSPLLILFLLAIFMPGTARADCPDKAVKCNTFTRVTSTASVWPKVFTRPSNIRGKTHFILTEAVKPARALMHPQSSILACTWLAAALFAWSQPKVNPVSPAKSKSACITKPNAGRELHFKHSKTAKDQAAKNSKSCGHYAPGEKSFYFYKKAAITGTKEVFDFHKLERTGYAGYEVKLLWEKH